MHRIPIIQAISISIILVYCMTACKIAHCPANSYKPFPYDNLQKTASLENLEVDESSGLAASYCYRGFLWTHNDDWNDTRLFRFDENGRDQGVFHLIGANARDWEGLAAFQMDGVPYLLIADVGDNRSIRENVTLYLVPEPGPDNNRILKSTRKIRIQYENGPRDVEAIAVDPASQQVILIEKNHYLANASIFIIPLLGKERLTRKTITATGSIPIKNITGLDISSDGLRAIVLTYKAVYEFQRDSTEEWQKAFQRSPRQVIKLPPGQWEAIAYGRGGKSIFLTKESHPTPLFKLSIK